jgi:hypothetical protein
MYGKMNTLIDKSMGEHKNEILIVQLVFSKNDVRHFYHLPNILSDIVCMVES